MLTVTLLHSLFLQRHVSCFVSGAEVDKTRCVYDPVRVGAGALIVWIRLICNFTNDTLSLSTLKI